MGVALQHPSLFRALPWASWPLAARVALRVVLLVAFVFVTVLVRGHVLGAPGAWNPDEAELIAQGRAAMRSIVPFTTWTTTTTGPVWVMFIAALGWLGFPLTTGFAHLLAAVLWGILGYLVLAVSVRYLPVWVAAIFTAAWWIPPAFTLPGDGSLADFGSLATELLPSVLVLLAALLARPDRLARVPVILGIGVLVGLAVAAKYQVAPVALGLVLLVGFVNLRGSREWLRYLGFGAIGAIAPVALIGLLMLVGGASGTLITQNLNFLGAYGDGIGLVTRIHNSIDAVVGEPWVIVLIVLVMLVAARSSPRIAILRIAVIVLGFLSVVAGGQGFAHYLIVVALAAAISLAAPVLPEQQMLVTWRPVVRWAWVVAFVVAIGAGMYGHVHRDFVFSTPATVATALSPDFVEREPSMEAACPPGSVVVVWGWAPELYNQYGWVNAIPFMNVSQLTSSPKNYDSGLDLMRSAMEDPSTDCVVDAVGAPFFGFDREDSLMTEYPQLDSLLESDYRMDDGALTCEACSVFIRRHAGG